ncbi:NAD(P)/FAD-dependent oxidoreductase [Streptomyces sp. RGM 3693]|uniref:NAD(P)/FAD-dependent oxidoreductase n=1 Tax=Streptomyces sp. RGM 3693 TaxID=3413284 RepID=UPI003D2C5FF5
MAEVDVLVVGAGVLGRSIAFALASAEPGIRVVLSGRQAAGASEAAGAMLGVLGEVTAASLEKEHSRLRLEMAIEAAGRWDGWLDRIGRYGAKSRETGHGRGTFMLLNAVSGPTDERAFAAIAEAGRRYQLPVQEIDPAEVPACRPVSNDRPLRALYLPDEAFLDARRWLMALDTALAALPNVTLAPPGDLAAAPADTYTLTCSDKTVFRAPNAVIAAGVWSTDLVHRIDPDLPVLPVAAIEGTAVTVSAPAALPAVLRTPNRAYACGLHAVPQADGTWYIGASAVPTPTPTAHPPAGALRFLLDNALSQLDHGLAGARIHAIHHGNRPVGLDGHPLVGSTSRRGLWVATGTHRDGLHASPLIAEELTAALLHNKTSTWLEPWSPERQPIADWRRDEAVEEAAAHHAALAAEARMRPPLTGAWPQTLQGAYRHQMAHLYEQLPRGFTLPPDLAPLGYAYGPHLATLLAAHRERRQRSTTR